MAKMRCASAVVALTTLTVVLAGQGLVTTAVKDLVGWALVEGQAYEKAHPAPVPPVKR